MKLFVPTNRWVIRLWKRGKSAVQWRRRQYEHRTWRVADCLTTDGLTTVERHRVARRFRVPWPSHSSGKRRLLHAPPRQRRRPLRSSHSTSRTATADHYYTVRITLGRRLVAGCAVYIASVRSATNSVGRDFISKWYPEKQ